MSREEHEKYLLKQILSHSLSSDNPSKKTIKKAYSKSNNYFREMKNNLLKKYENKSVSDFPGSKVIGTDSGQTLQITSKDKIDFKIRDNDFRNNLKSNLKLVPYVGPTSEKKLIKEGYKNIEDLLEHNKYSTRAEETLDKIENLDTASLIKLIKKNRYSKKCKQDVLKSLSLIEPENLKFMDIETLGLKNCPIILIGIAEIKNSNIISTQYLLRDKDEEVAVLEGYLSHLDEYSVHVTFNGKFFDVPFIENRLNYYGMNSKRLTLPHYDLLYYARYLWKDKLPNCKLQTIEKNIFGLDREGDVPGKYVPEFYETYLREDNIGPIVPIVNHNKQDIVSLADFIMKMYEEVNERC